jgi:sec-independent protein translocase protein TatA
MGIENPIHLIFLAAVALLVLGPKRLPEVARSLGKGIREFREAMSMGDGSVGANHDRYNGVGGVSAPAPAPAPPTEAGVASAAPIPAVAPVEHGVVGVPVVPAGGEEIEDADVVSSVSASVPQQVDPPEPVRSDDASDRRPL